MRLFPRRPAARTAARSTCLQVNRLEDRTVPALTLHSPAGAIGALLPHVDVQSIYLGAGWTNNPDRVSDISKFEQFTKFIVSPRAGYLSMSKAYRIGAGKSEAGFVDPIALGASIDDTQIQAEIQRLISNDPRAEQPNRNRLYQVFIAPGVEVTSGGANSANNFCAYHSSFGGTDVKGKAFPVIAYSVMPYQGTGVNAQNPDLVTGLTLSHTDAITVAASHELTEAATDATPGKGWWDSDQNSPFFQNENMDCANARDFVLGGFVVQRNVSPDETKELIAKGGIQYSYFAGVVHPTGGDVSGFNTGTGNPVVLPGLAFVPAGTNYNNTASPVPLDSVSILYNGH